MTRVFLDGAAFGDHAVVVALGVDIDCRKRILGLREGATENAPLVTDLVASLQDRGLVLAPRVTFVLDGAKALRKAVRRAFGERVVVQRSILHKLRNVQSYLPPKWHGEARRRPNAARGMTNPRVAREAVRSVLAWLEGLSESAAASLAEGFEETLTVHRLGITSALRRTLQATNPIESANRHRPLARAAGAALERVINGAAVDGLRPVPSRPAVSPREGSPRDPEPRGCARSPALDRVQESGMMHVPLPVKSHKGTDNLTLLRRWSALPFRAEINQGFAC